MRIEDVKKDLGEDAKLFDFDEKDGVVAAKLKSFLKPNEFRDVAKRVKENANGVYVPKNEGGPYFVFKGVSTATSEKKAQLTLLGHVRLAINELKFIENELEKGEVDVK